MDKLDRYRCLIKQILSQSPYYQHGSASPEVDTILILDDMHDNYLLMDIGWQETSRIRRTILHVRIKNGKIWIEEDWTEEGITDALLKAGVAQEDIVLGFQPPNMRPLTDFAAA